MFRQTHIMMWCDNQGIQLGSFPFPAAVINCIFLGYIYIYIYIIYIIVGKAAMIMIMMMMLMMIMIDDVLLILLSAWKLWPSVKCRCWDAPFVQLFELIQRWFDAESAPKQCIKYCELVLDIARFFGISTDRLRLWACTYNFEAGWWFGTFVIFHNIWDNPSHD